MEDHSGVVNFSKKQIVQDEALDYSQAKDVQTDDEDFEIAERQVLAGMAELLSTAERSLKVAKFGKYQLAASRTSESEEPTISGRGGLLEKSQALQDLVKDVVKMLDKSETTISDLKEQIAGLQQKQRESLDELKAEVKAANARAADAEGRAENVEYALETAETSLVDLKRVNRVLILENALAVEQLKRHNVLGVEIPLLKVADSLSENNSSGDLRMKVTPLDPTSRQARLEASPIGTKKSSQDWSSGLTPEISSSRVSTPQSQSKLLERNRRRMLLIDQSPSTPIAIENNNTSEAVDALVDDLMTRLNMVDLDISYKKVADYQYKIGDKMFHLKNINGRLFTLRGGGYQDLLVVLTSFLRF